MEFKLVTGELSRLTADAVIIGVLEDEKDIIDYRELASLTQRLRERKEVKGSASEITPVHGLDTPGAGKFLLLGLGKKDELTPAKLRSILADGCRAAQRSRCRSLVFVLPETGIGTTETAQALAEGAVLGSYVFENHLSRKSEFEPLTDVGLLANQGQENEAFQQGSFRGRTIAEAVSLARDLANEPSNHMTPADLADVAARIGADDGVEVEIIERDRMAELGMGGLLAVSRGSAASNPPKLIILRYRGRDTEGWDLGLVGKGLTFDSGGVSIKPSEKMEEMKFDMSGGAAVLAAMRAIARLKPAVNVIAAVPATENMPDGGAFKPGDVIKMFNGKTVEVISTDAEGRLILADALSYLDREKPKAMVDIATLTGAVIIALGNQATAAITNNRQLLDKVIAAGESAGERIWQLPSWPEYREQYKGVYGDIKNVGGRPAGTITAGLFLSEFISPETPWVHLDIAGTAWGDKEKGHLTKGASGVPVATLIGLAENLAKG